MGRIELTIAPELAGIVRAASALIEGLPGGPSLPLDELLSTEIERLRAADEGRTAGRIERLVAARRLYRALGLDPTRHRPSPEALLRRVLRGDPFPRIHPAVDLANLWALEHGLPVGLYDARKLDGKAIELRLGLPGESYPGIRRPEIHLEGRMLLADASGPFGNPTADSLRTAVDPTTRDALAVVFAPADHPEDALRGWLSWLDRAARDRLGARSVSTELARPAPPQDHARQQAAPPGKARDRR